MNKPNILIVEDEEKIARVLELELTFEGYSVKKAFDGAEGFQLFQSDVYDLIILDVMLPKMSGIEVLRRIRTLNPQIKIILVTAKDSIEDKVSGLDLGANDYITKPFHMEELLARVRACLRQPVLKTPSHTETEDSADWLRFSDIRLNDRTREVYRENDLIDLTPREFDFLAYLLKHPRQVLHRDQILQAVWGYDYYGDTNVVDVYIRYLRNKLDKPYGKPLIQTVRGVGYVLRETP